MSRAWTIAALAAFAGACTVVSAQDDGPRPPQTGREEPRSPTSDERQAIDVERSALETERGSRAVVAIADIDPDALLFVQRQLAIRGWYLGPVDGHASPDLDDAMRRFARALGIEAPAKDGTVAARTIDELGAGPEVAKRWGSTAPRAPELTSDECYRMNYALVTRGYREDKKTPAAVDAQTVAALRHFQQDTGHPVLLGNYIPRRWLFILGVATPESCPPPSETTVPAGAPRNK